ncbi:MAG TPA: thiolase family protein [bacterium]|nr:thiolase family protein [bacterium]
MSAQPVILGVLRTPMVRAGAELRDVPAKELARGVIAELLARTGTPAARVDEVILGNAGTPADAPNIARVAALLAGVPEAVPGLTVHRNCASGLEAVMLAAEKVAAGSAGLIIAGGTESMSRIPMQLPADANPWFVRWAKARSLGARLSALAAVRPKTFAPKSALLEGLTDPVCGLNMGRTAENLAREFGITRDDQDAFALESHLRAVAAGASGRLAKEITPAFVGPRFDRVIEHDIGPREGQSREALAKLRPVFDRRDGTVTAGNSCQITDGAAAVIVASEVRAAELGIRPLARIRGAATVGLSPARMGLGPAYALPAALDRAGLALNDVDRIEINEAFAAQVIACELALDSEAFCREELNRPVVGAIDPGRRNVNGGAIALGHPIGATGARLITTLVTELVESGTAVGVATLCVGGGQGSAVVVERAA